MLNLDTVAVNGTEYTIGNSPPAVVEHKITITPTTTLDDVRWLPNGSQSSLSGYKTYLIPMGSVPQQLVKCVTNDVPYSGVYALADGVYTHTTAPGAHSFQTMYPDANYTGWWVSTNKAINWEFYTGVDVVTVGGEDCDRLGFKGVSSEYFPFVVFDNGYGAIQFPMTDNAVYLIDVGNVVLINFWYRRSASATEKSNSYAVASTITDGNTVFISSMTDVISYGKFRANAANDLVALCKRGVYLYRFSDHAGVTNARKKLPVKLIGHGTNTLPQFMQSMANGWAGSELDIRKTADGVYVCNHSETVSGITISESSYEAAKTAMPELMTLNEALEFLSQFDDAWIDLHLSNISDAEERMNLLRLVSAHDINAGYYVGISGNIGDYTAKSFYKTGMAYGFAFNSAGNASAPTSDDDPMTYKYFVYAGSDKMKPYLFNMISDVGNVDYSYIAAGNFDGYQFAQLYYNANIMYEH